MHFSLLPLALLATSAAASSPASKPTFTKHHSFHAVLARGAALLARQDNYVPETTECDLGGDTCETACGPTSVECPSNNAEMTFCYDKAQEHCCPNGDGSVCETGYYCATGQAGETYCCADGMGKFSSRHASRRNRIADKVFRPRSLRQSLPGGRRRRGRHNHHDTHAADDDDPSIRRHAALAHADRRLNRRILKQLFAVYAAVGVALALIVFPLVDTDELRDAVARAQRHVCG